MTSRFSLLALGVLLLGGCTAASQPPAAAESEPAAQAAAPAQPHAYQPFSQQLLYRLLVGEIASQRNQLPVALRSYIQAAEEAKDPRVAKQAVRLSLIAKDDRSGLLAARRWAELDPQDVAARKTLAVLSLRNGLVEDGVNQMEQMLALSGNEEERFAVILKLLADEEDKETVLTALAGLSRRHPDDPQILYAYAYLAVEAEKPEIARPLVEKLLAQRPDWMEARLLRARLLMAAGDDATALTELAAAVADRPDDRKLRLSYARLLIKGKRLEEAKGQFKILAEGDDQDGDALFALALIALELEQLDEAKGHLEKLLDNERRRADAQFYLGHIAERQGQTDEALAHYSEVDEGDHQLNALMRKIALLAAGGRLGEARDELQSLRDENPKLATRLYLMEGELLRQSDAYDDAFELYRQALAENPGDPDLLYAQALIAERLGRVKVLEKNLLAVLKNDPENAQALNALGYTLADRTNRYQEALRYILRAYKLKPDDAAVTDSMGWVHYRLGKLKEAEEYLRRAYQLNNDPEIAAHLGEVLWARGKRDEARTLWEEAKGRDGDDPVLKAVMERFVK